MQIYSKSDAGMVRSSNQDAFVTAKIADTASLAIVCDGMGGANAGNIASEMAVKLISDYIIRSYSPGQSASRTEKLLKNAIDSANIEIYDKSLKNPELEGMGTTVVVALAEKGGITIAHVGDSRAYVVADDVTQLTRDHSVVQSLIESGKITPEDAKVHPRKNVITRALGVEESVIVDFCNVSLSENECLLLCTDGLSGFIDQKVIADVIKSGPLESVPEKLVSIANKNGGGDNITVVVMKQ